MNSRNKQILINAAISFVLTFLFYFEHLIHQWTNVYQLRKGSVFFDNILSIYDLVQNTDIGFFMYFHLFIVGFTSSKETFTVWLYANFILTFYILYRLIRFLRKRLELKRPAKKQLDTNR